VHTHLTGVLICGFSKIIENWQFSLPNYLNFVIKLAGAETRALYKLVSWFSWVRCDPNMNNPASWYYDAQSCIYVRKKWKTLI
jgi:hypothetical protein